MAFSHAAQVWKELGFNPCMVEAMLNRTSGQDVDYFLLFFAYNHLVMSRFDRPVHRVYCSFFSREGWHVQFTEADLKTPLPRRLTFAGPEKIRQLARKGEALGDSESRQMLEAAIAIGRGGFYLRLNHEQYMRLAGK